jgi:hypothetical protein
MYTTETANSKKKTHRIHACAAMLGLMVIGGSNALGANPMPNACPVDGCEVKIVGVKKAGKELEITFKSNFTPDVSKNHFHVWWGENYTVQQAGRSAERVYGVKQGKWHRHDDYPVYITQGAASTKVRGKAKTICVSAADRDHNILDVKIYDCKDVSPYL